MEQKDKAGIQLQTIKVQILKYDVGVDPAKGEPFEILEREVEVTKPNGLTR